MVDLPLPLGPTMASTSPARTSNDSVLEHRRAAVERQRHIFERDVAAHRRQRERRGAFLHLDRLVEDLRHAAQRHARGGEVRVHPISACSGGRNRIW